MIFRRASSPVLRRSVWAGVLTAGGMNQLRVITTTARTTWEVSALGRRNPIQVIGDPMNKGVTWLSDELIRAAAHDDALGSDGLVAMAYLLSCASRPGASRVWETSAAEISVQFGWGRNRERATKALERAVKDQRLVMREYVRDGSLVSRRRAYVVCAGGRRFTDEELLEWSAPIILRDKAGAQ